jgi:hypothetical protein
MLLSSLQLLSFLLSYYDIPAAVDIRDVPIIPASAVSLMLTVSLL